MTFQRRGVTPAEAAIGLFALDQPAGDEFLSLLRQHILSLTFHKLVNTGHWPVPLRRCTSQHVLGYPSCSS